MNTIKGTILRDLGDPWNAGMKQGEMVYRYYGYTYGCVSDNGVAVTREPNKEPFFEVPVNAVKWER